MTLEERVARLEQELAELRRAPAATRVDLLEAKTEIRRDIADLASGIGADLHAIRGDMAEIRRLLERRPRWPWA